MMLMQDCSMQIDEFDMPSLMLCWSPHHQSQVCADAVAMHRTCHAGITAHAQDCTKQWLMLTSDSNSLEEVQC